MPWTVGCFCGQTFTAPPMRCPHCASRLPDPTVRRRPRATHARTRIDGDHDPPKQ
jgi:hypothetical protein